MPLSVPYAIAYVNRAAALFHLAWLRSSSRILQRSAPEKIPSLGISSLETCYEDFVMKSLLNFVRTGAFQKQLDSLT